MSSDIVSQVIDCLDALLIQGEEMKRILMLPPSTPVVKPSIAVSYLIESLLERYYGVNDTSFLTTKLKSLLRVSDIVQHLNFFKHYHDDNETPVDGTVLIHLQHLLGAVLSVIRTYLGIYPELFDQFDPQTQQRYFQLNQYLGVEPFLSFEQIIAIRCV